MSYEVMRKYQNNKYFSKYKNKQKLLNSLFNNSIVLYNYYL